MAPKRSRPAETDLKSLKALSHTLLELDIQPTKMSPLVVKHPFTDSGVVGLRKEDGGIDVADLTSDPASLHLWREQMGRLIDDAGKPIDLFMMITKPYKLGFLKYAAPYLSEQDTALFLSQAWIIAEAPNSDPNLTKRELLALFRSVDPQKLMDEEEYGIFRGLDDVVTVYRGVTSYNAKNVKALSWTLNRDTAEWFAHRYGEQGTVYEAQIRKEHICAVFLGRNEAEVIVDPSASGISPQCRNRNRGRFFSRLWTETVVVVVAATSERRCKNAGKRNDRGVQTHRDLRQAGAVHQRPCGQSDRTRWLVQVRYPWK